MEALEAVPVVAVVPVAATVVMMEPEATVADLVEAVIGIISPELSGATKY